MTRIRIVGERDIDSLTLGVCLVGEKGSGKTSLMLRMFNDLMRDSNPILAIDTGDHLVERAKAFNHDVPVTRFAATKEGGHVIDFAKVLSHPVDIVTALDKLIPADKADKNFFFLSLARDYVESSIHVLNHYAPLRWKPHDLTWLCSEPKILSAICKSTEGKVKDPAGAGFSKEATKDVLGTVRAFLRPLSLYTALGDHQPLADPLSIIVSERGVSILEWSDRDAAMLEPTYAMVLELAASRAMSRTNPNKALGIFTDEIRSLVRLDFPSAVAVRGRRPKIIFCFSVHTVSGLIDRYTEHRAKELIGVMGNQVFLRIGDPTTAKLAADIMGKYEVLEGVVQGQGHESRSIKEIYRVRPEEFMGLPFPDVKNDVIRGFARTPNHLGAFRCPFMKDTTFRAPAPLRMVPDEYYRPKPRGERDLGRLRIPLTPDVIRAMREI